MFEDEVEKWADECIKEYTTLQERIKQLEEINAEAEIKKENENV